MESALCCSEEPFGVVGLAADGVQLLREGGWSHSSRSSSSSSLSSLNAGRDIGIECGSSSDSDSLSDSDGSDSSGYSSGLAAEVGAERAKKQHAGGSSCEEASLARPAHPAALHALYWTFVFNCFSEQSWRFAGAALLALLHQSILPVAVARFASQLVACVAAPLVGDLLDSAPRVPALRVILVAQSSAIMVGAAATMHALHLAYPAAVAPAAADSADTSSATSALSALPAAALLQQGWFVVLLVAGAVERVMGLVTGVAVEIDWVLVVSARLALPRLPSPLSRLVGEDRPELMATAMATLGRIEQFGEVAGAFIFGGLIATYGPLVCVKACIALAALSIPALLALTALTNHLSHGALSHTCPPESSESSQGLVPAVDAAAEDTNAAALPHVLDAAPLMVPSGQAARPGGSFSMMQEAEWASDDTLISPTNPARTALTTTAALPFRALPVENTLWRCAKAAAATAVAVVAAAGAAASAMGRAAGKGWRCMMQEAVMPASMAYVLLCFNAVLAPGGLMTSFLFNHGVGMAVIGAFSSACAAMGFVACFISPALVARLGILQAGSIAILFQATMLALAVLDFSSLPLCPPFLHQGLLMLFLLLVVLSRMGQGMYQIVGCQIIQAVPAASANLFGTTEMALGSLAELAMLSLAILFHDPKYFGALMLMSFAAVLAAAALYCHWLARPDPRLAKLFPNQPKFWWGNLLCGGMGGKEGEREEEALLREEELGLRHHRRREAGDEEVRSLRDRQV
ncbi:unnamed protein product [Closterium sp. NIES-65]|nr:unnamed protein product [Closterium sp. NIES-65]